jgi:tetratricopeptide (TPR) repeat protein
MLIPVIGLVQVGVQAMADRYTYLPSIGISIIIAWAIAELLPSKPALRAPATVAAVLILAVLVILTRAQLTYWRDSQTLFTHALAVTQNNPVMHNNLGSEFLESGQPARALEHFDKALAIDPRYYRAASNKARANMDMGHIDEAMEILRKVTEADPDSPDAYNFLGLAYDRKKENAAAVQCYRKAIALNPNYLRAWNNLGLSLKALGSMDEAAQAWQTAIAIDPDYANPHYSLGLYYANQGHLPQAVEHLTVALRIRPDWAEAHYNLAAVYYRLGNIDKSIQHCRKAIELKPDYTIALHNLAKTLEEQTNLANKRQQQNKSR